MRTCGVKIDRNGKQEILCYHKSYGTINILTNPFDFVSPAISLNFNEPEAPYLKVIVVSSDLVKALVGVV